MLFKFSYIDSYLFIYIYLHLFNMNEIRYINNYASAKMNSYNVLVISSPKYNLEILYSYIYIYLLISLDDVI